MIRVENVSVVFGRTRALRAVDVTILPGVTGLFGPNASGKSTLLRVVAGLLRPSAGTITFEDDALAPADAENMRRRIGYAGHASGLYARLSVRENLELFTRLYGAPREHVDELLPALGLEERAPTAVGDLSAGFKRRAAVARALVHAPRILLLDEPYANLDDEASLLVSAAIRAWWAPGRIAIVATHGAKKVKGFADASLVLQRGAVVSYRVRAPQGAQA